MAGNDDIVAPCAARIGRREFVRGAAAAVAGLWGLGGAKAAERPGAGTPASKQAARFSAPGRVVRVVDPMALPDKERFPDPKRIRSMLERAMVELTGQRDPGRAFAAMFGPRDVVGIKVSCLGRRMMATNVESVDAVIAGLLAAGVPEGQILVWEQYQGNFVDCRFPIQAKPGKVRYLPNADRGYGPGFTVAGRETAFSDNLLETTALINMPVIKDHDLSGITCALKNVAFGAVRSPRRFHPGGCDPSIAEIFNRPEIRERHRLVVCDAVRAVYEGGPRDSSHKTRPGSLYVTTDPVAMDVLAAELVDAARKENKLPSLALAKRPPRFIKTAAGLGLGVGEREKLRLLEISV